MIVAIYGDGLIQISERCEDGTYDQWFMGNHCADWSHMKYDSYGAVMEDHNKNNDDILFNDDPNNTEK